MNFRISLLSAFLFFVGSTQGQTTVGVFQNSQASYNGYTLIAPLNSTETYLIDNCGRVVNQWVNSNYKPGASVDLLPDGSLLRTGKLLTGSAIAGGSGGRIEIYDWNDSLTWSYNFDSPTERQHHDVRPLANGNLLVLAWDIRSAQEAKLKGLDTIQYNGIVWSEKVVEIKPLGKDSAQIIWEWYLWDHLVQDFDRSLPNFDTISNHPELLDFNYSGNTAIGLDYYHANGMDYNPDLDQILISVRNIDEIWVIDHSTTTLEAASSTGGNAGMGGDFLYRWGNPEVYGRGGISDKTLFGMHNPNWIPQGYRDEGDIMVFNNGFNRNLQESYVEIIEPPIVGSNYAIGANTSFAPLAPSWSFRVPVFVDFVSGARRLPNGNTFICSGPDGHLYELDSLDQLVWEYVSPAEINGALTSQGNIPSGNTLFRAERYGENYPAFTNRTLTPGNRLEQNPLPFNCTIYSNSTGIAESKNETAMLRLIENPIRDQIRLKSKVEEPTLVRIFDVNGRLLHEQNFTSSSIRVDAQAWSNQMLIVLAIQGNRVEKFKVIKQ